jgi:hypothetical protein
MRWVKHAACRRRDAVVFGFLLDATVQRKPNESSRVEAHLERQTPRFDTMSKKLMQNLKQ